MAGNQSLPLLKAQDMGPKRRTTQDLPANWQGEVLALAHQGASEQRIRDELGLSINGFYGLLRREPEFNRIILMAREMRLSRRLNPGV